MPRMNFPSSLTPVQLTKRTVIPFTWSKNWNPSSSHLLRKPSRISKNWQMECQEWQLQQLSLQSDFHFSLEVLQKVWENLFKTSSRQQEAQQKKQFNLGKTTTSTNKMERLPPWTIKLLTSPAKLISHGHPNHLRMKDWREWEWPIKTSLSKQAVLSI